MLAAASVLAAWAIDARFGEPRSSWHPVAWFGRVMSFGEGLTRWPPAAAFIGGAVAWAAGVGLVALAGHALQRWIGSLPMLAAVPLLALALKPALAWRMLRDEVGAVETGLAEGLDEGRRRLSRLCSRDVRSLDASQVRETAIESLAENFNDSLVAPLFWFVVAGLPGAWAWRAANTLDAMWGYRGRWNWAGKWAARADDVLAFVPARLAAALLWRPAIRCSALRREARATPSLNGGWPMAAMALRLNVRLGKPGVYALNAGAPPPGADALRAALAITRQAAALAFAVAAGATLAGTGAMLLPMPGWSAR